MDRPSAATKAPFHVRFWGVRGSVPTPRPSHLAFGGNTPCLEIQCPGDDLFVLDAGTGIHALGQSLAARPRPPGTIHLFFTHFHWDHIQGLPYFAPLFRADSRIVLHSAHPAQELRAALQAQMHAPFFPVDFTELAASIEFQTMQLHQALHFAHFAISCFPLHHPQGSVGFRVAAPGKSVVYATDHEHGNALVDSGLRETARGVDALIYDAQYTPGEYESRRGWGHSTWREGVRVAREAEVRQLVLFHHDPARDDQAIDRIVAQAQTELPQVCAAHEGMTL